MTLGPDARALLEAARGGDEPSFDDAARVRAKLAARLAVSAAAGAAATVASKPAAAAGSAVAGGAGASASVVAKLAVGLALVSAATATSVVVTEPAEPPRVLRMAPPAPVASRPAPVVARPTSVSPAPSPAPPPTPEPAPPTPLPTPLRPPKPASAEQPAADELVAEAAAIRRAHALLASDPAAALAVLDEHAARFPRGALAEERRGLRVLALCGAGRTAEGRAEAAAFLAAAPRSPLADRVRAACER